jgi:hypothetical protein
MKVDVHQQQHITTGSRLFAVGLRLCGEYSVREHGKGLFFAERAHIKIGKKLMAKDGLRQRSEKIHSKESP